MPGRALSDGTKRVLCSLFWVVEQKCERPVGARSSSCEGGDGPVPGMLRGHRVHPSSEQGKRSGLGQTGWVPKRSPGPRWRSSLPPASAVETAAECMGRVCPTDSSPHCPQPPSLAHSSSSLSTWCTELSERGLSTLNLAGAAQWFLLFSLPMHAKCLQLCFPLPPLLSREKQELSWRWLMIFPDRNCFHSRFIGHTRRDVQESLRAQQPDAELVFPMPIKAGLQKPSLCAT